MARRNYHPIRVMLSIMAVLVLLTGCVATAEARQRRAFTEYLENNGYPVSEETLAFMKSQINVRYTDLFRELLVDNDTGVSLESFMICSHWETGVKQLRARYERFGADGFNLIPWWVYAVNNGCDQLVEIEGAKLGEFARYLWYMEKHGVDAAMAVHDVNLGLDIPAEPGDYTDLTEDNTEFAQEVVLQQLVNRNIKTRELSSWFGWFYRDMIQPEEKYGDEGVLVEVSILQEFMRMADALHEDTGKTIKIKTGYLSNQQQAELYDKAVAEHGEEYAERHVPQPGHSEHQTAIAIDIYEVGTDMEDFAQTESYSWLMEHAHEYCFWLRYPDYKEYITGYPFTPYHFHFYPTSPPNEAYYLQKLEMTYEEMWYLTAGFN